MDEEFGGVKFRVLLREELPGFSQKEHGQAAELLSWCKRFAEAGIAPHFDFGGKKRSAGNLSFRAHGGFVITSSGKDFASVSLKDLVLVKKCSFEEGVVHAQGFAPPSSETLMHFLIYEGRPEINAVFHGHDDVVLETAQALGVLETPRPCPYGSKELARWVAETLGKTGKYAVIKEHGFTSIGSTMEDAGKTAFDVHNKALVLKI